MQALFLAFLFIVVGAGVAGAQGGDQMITLETRPGQSIRVLVLRPAAPSIGSVVLIAGGHGNLAISDDGRLGWGAGNNLVRTRGLYAEAGFVTAVPDIAPEFKRAGGVEEGYRASEGHARDLGALIAHLRADTPAVWLIGTSRGAISVANAAARLTGPGRPDGIVISSGVLMSHRSNDLSASSIRGLDRIAVPTLLIAHEMDQCRVTPASDAEQFRRLLKGAPRVDVKFVSGGISRGDPCEAFAYHGFNGIEREVVDLTTAWLKANTPSR